MKKVGKSSKKGFTLVELIVVLVILAILAAMLVPALVGYIDRAKKEKEFQAASTVYTAAQALATEAYGKAPDVTVEEVLTVEEIVKLTGITNIKSIAYSLGEADEENPGAEYTITEFSVQFESGNWYTYNYGASTWDTDTAALGSNTVNKVAG